MSLKLVLLFVACCMALATAMPSGGSGPIIIIRRARSPQPGGGSVDLGYYQGQGGREANVQYNHNLYSSRDGRGTIDAYAQGSRNFDHNRNNFGGGIQGSWSF